MGLVGLRVQSMTFVETALLFNRNRLFFDLVFIPSAMQTTIVSLNLFI